MTMTDTTTRPEPPAWLNLSAIVDESLIAELAAIGDDAEALEPQVRSLAIRAFRALEALNTATEHVTDNFPPEASDGVHAAIDGFAGGTRVFLLMHKLSDHVEAASLDPGNKPDWFDEEASKTPRPEMWARVGR